MLTGLGILNPSALLYYCLLLTFQLPVCKECIELQYTMNKVSWSKATSFPALGQRESREDDLCLMLHLAVALPMGI